MFVIHLEYTAPLEEIDRHLQAHRDFLEMNYQKGLLLASGPQEPRTGGVIIALGNDRTAIETMIQNDPFSQHHVARYTVTAFTPVKYRPEMEALL